MADDLVERVARAMCTSHGYEPDDLTYREARAAIAVVLQEAAKEVEKWQQVHFDDGGNMHVSNITFTIAAAIRALIPQEP